MYYWDRNWYGFKLMIKCMAGSTMDKGKFIVAVPEKMKYSESFERCDRLGLQICLPSTSEEQIFMNSLTDFISYWLRIQFVNNSSNKII